MIAESQIEASRSSLQGTTAESWKDTLIEFTRASAHSLRGPAGQLRILLGLLLESVPASSDPDTVTYLKSAADRLAIVVEGVASCAAVFESTYRFARVSSADALDLALIRFEPWLKKGELAVERGTLPDVMADRTQLSKVFEHLIENSLRFRAGDSVRVTVSASNEEALRIFSYSDDGIGIDHKYRGQLFRPFHRLCGEKSAGAGVGLFICKQIVEAHGGQIWLAETPSSGGVRFDFSIPADSPQ